MQVLQVEVPRLAGNVFGSPSTFSDADPPLTAVLGRKCGLDKSKWPLLNFIIVGKRYHVRFFPGDDHPAC